MKQEVIFETENFLAFRIVSSQKTSVRWHGFNLKPWHVGVMAKRSLLSHRDLKFVGVVTSVSIETFTFFRNVHGKFQGENYLKDGFIVPKNGISTSFRIEKEFLDCIEIAVSSLDVAEGVTKSWSRPNYYMCPGEDY